MSERRASRLIGADSKMVRYRSQRRSDRDLRERMRELAAERRRFGYRRLHVLLRREGLVQNRKKTQRASTAKRDWRSGVAAAASGPPALGRRFSCQPGPTRAGRSTSCMISSPRGGAFAS